MKNFLVSFLFFLRFVIGNNFTKPQIGAIIYATKFEYF